MKSARYFVAALLIFVGAIWILQGANILPGSFMTGQIEWLIAGIVCVLLGIALLIDTRRREMNEASGNHSMRDKKPKTAWIETVPEDEASDELKRASKTY
jgi:uncharacterized membrane protein HdeD (DUF308 family)